MKLHRSPRSLCAMIVALCLPVAMAIPPAHAADNEGSSELGAEMRNIEKETLQTPQDWAADRNPDWENFLEKPAPEPPPASATTEEPVAVKEVRIEGDRAFLEETGIAAKLKQDTVGKSLTEHDILTAASRCRDMCILKGYYLALVTPRPVDRASGVLTVDVDAGRVGQMTFCDSRGAGNRQGDVKTPYSGRFFGESQLRRQMSNLAGNPIFNYNEFYRAVFAVNAHPDLAMDTDLKVRKETDSGVQKRYADMVFYVKEERPVHATVEFKNTGTEATGNWRASATVQHLNLTRHSDVLTLNTIASTDFEALRSLAGSYYLPWAGSRNAVTFYGGYSEMAANDIVPLFDLTGQGWFAGAQVSFMLARMKKDIVTVSFSGVSRHIRNTMTMTSPCEDGSAGVSDESATIVPVSVTVSYSAGNPDRLGGRNFLTSQTSFNAGKILGGSDGDELAAQRAGAGADYLIERLQVARLQPLFGRAGASGKRAQWILFTKLDGQYSTATLIPVEQKAVGGMDSVRGYPEREVMGDNGISGTIELRTPLFSGLFSRGKGEESIDNFQLLTFADAGYVAVRDPAEGEKSSQSLLGVGVGARMAVTSHSLVRFDWGFPLEETETSDKSGRAHISVQALF